jgi:hypothetical protein
MLVEGNSSEGRFLRLTIQSSQTMNQEKVTHANWVERGHALGWHLVDKFFASYLLIAKL